jgi:hypothetical protein
MLLSIVRMYVGDHWTYALQTVQVDVSETTRRTLLVGILWVMPGRTKHHLDHCTRTIGRTLGLLDVRWFDIKLVADFPYN